LTYESEIFAKFGIVFAIWTIFLPLISERDFFPGDPMTPLVLSMPVDGRIEKHPLYDAGFLPLPFAVKYELRPRGGRMTRASRLRIECAYCPIARNSRASHTSRSLRQCHGCFLTVFDIHLRQD
jgi:hypothetical protein